MLDYNTLNNLVEFFNKNGIKNIQLESGSTIEVKEGALLVNGEEVGGAEYIAGEGITINNNVIRNSRAVYKHTIIINTTGIDRLYVTFNIYNTISSALSWDLLRTSLDPDSGYNFISASGYRSIYDESTQTYNTLPIIGVIKKRSSVSLIAAVKIDNSHEYEEISIGGNVQPSNYIDNVQPIIV